MIAPMTLTRSFSPPIHWLKATPRVLAGTIAACALALGLSLESQAHYDHWVSQAQPPSASAPALAQQAPSPFPAPGQYLFGQASEPDQLGHGYIVLESNGQDIYGALYFPGSSFDCFQGRVENNALAMTITDSYSQEVYPYAIALVPTSAIATELVGHTTVPLNLDGFHALNTLTENDLRMLNTCKADLMPES
jgi:hypothetical protein